ncbi:MAG: hypothetical protein PF517_05995 [Salinivirgaceae bacterium]|jgi:hypothetical protein|nr:hypothetical protein [Salinivirgaceae bacterium]
MLKIGIVGKNNSEQYISIVNSIRCYKFVGVFDPSFQFESPKNIDSKLVYYSFEELMKKSEAIVFANAEKIYLPLIELAIKYSKAVFLHGIHNLSLSEQYDILKLQEEAQETIQIQQTILFNSVFKEYQNICESPLLLQFFYANSNEKKLLLQTRSAVTGALTLFKSNIKKVTANTIAACNEVPDILKIRIDFDNGSICELTTNTVEPEKQFLFNCFEYEGFYKVDLENNNLLGTKNNKQISFKSPQGENTLSKIIERQLVDFYHNVRNFETPLNSVENEMLSQQVIERVKEKLRINMSIF